VNDALLGESDAPDVKIETWKVKAWQAAVDEYVKTGCKERSNDPLPRRMGLLLDHLSGVSFSELERQEIEENGKKTGKLRTTSLSRDLQKAKGQDVPRMKELYKALPDLKLD
jgi:hypothetical protein